MNQEINDAEFMAVIEPCKATLWLIQGLKKSYFDSSEQSAERISLLAPAVPEREDVRQKKKEAEMMVILYYPRMKIQAQNVSDDVHGYLK